MHLKKLITGIVLSFLMVNLVIADTSTSYNIDISELNSEGSLASSTNFKLNDTLVGFVDGFAGNSPSYSLGSGLVFLEQWCGNSIIEFGETCDDGNLISGDGCSSTCRQENVCGNGILEVGEQCDDGNLFSGDGCSATCAIEIVAVCGNGILEVGEQCDDGNLISGDGCSSTCAAEVPSPRGAGGVFGVCGDGILNFGEACDDNNKVSGDGCSATCRIEIPIVEGRTIRIKARPEKRVNTPGNWATSARLIFYNRDTGKVELTTTVNLNDAGWGTLTTEQIPDGTYDIALKGLSHLSKVKRREVISTQEHTLDFTFGDTFFLLAGDIHESKDDFINALDITAAVNKLYKNDLHADLNRDGTVNALDIAITVNNLWKSGEKI